MISVLKYSVLIIVILILAIFIDKQPDDFFMNTVYTVSGIMFSIGLGLIVTFNLQGIKNREFITAIRQNLNQVRDSYILYFTLSTVVYIADKYVRTPHISGKFTFVLFDLNISINLSIALLFVMLLSIIYFIVNFLQLQRLNNEIYDELN